MYTNREVHVGMVTCGKDSDIKTWPLLAALFCIDIVKSLK